MTEDPQPEPDIDPTTGQLPPDPGDEHDVGLGAERDHPENGDPDG